MSATLARMVRAPVPPDPARPLDAARTPGIGEATRRMAGWIKPPAGGDPLDHLYCPRGHHIPRRKVGQFQESGVLTCDYKEPPGQSRPCGAQVFLVFVLRRVTGDDGERLRRIYAAEVDWREIAYMEQAHMDTFEMLDWLGSRYDPPRGAGATRVPDRLAARVIPPRVR